MSNNNSNNRTTEMINTKKKLTLDFSQTPKLQVAPPLSALLASASPATIADLSMLKNVDTPDLIKVDTPTIENIILNNNAGALNTPSPSLLFPLRSAVTIEQETFAGGFVEALNNLHNNNNNNNININNQGSDSNSSALYGETSGGTTTTTSTGLMRIKEEPHTVPNVLVENNNGGASSTPPMSPVDMAYQERMKLERKRQRNRVAASKCRTRKLERISKLEDRVKQLKNENADLGSIANQLKEHVGLLKLEVLEHANNGCTIIPPQY